MKYLNYFENKNKIIYPYNEISYFIYWFNEIYSEIAEKQGWAIFSSDSQYPSNKFITDSKPYGNFWQVESVDELDILNDTEAYKLANKMGLILDDEYGVVIGYNGVSFLEKPKELDIYKNVTYYNL